MGLKGPRRHELGRVSRVSRGILFQHDERLGENVNLLRHRPEIKALVNQGCELDSPLNTIRTTGAGGDQGGRVASAA